MIRVCGRPDLAKLLGLLCPDGVGAELGVRDGAHANTLHTLARPRLMHLVDLWNKTLAPWRDGTRVELTPAAQLEAVRRRLAEGVRTGSVVLHQTDTVEWLRSQPNASLDWAYLDSDHAYSHVAAELAECSRAVRPGGWICGHDYCSTFFGVVRAVNGWCKSHNSPIVAMTAEVPVPVWNGSLESFLSYAIQVRK